MAEIDAVRAAVGDRRDELVALVRALVSHPSENPKLLADAGAQARATAAEAACQDAMSAELVGARLADRPLRGAARTRRRRRPAGRRGRRAFADPQRARRRRAGRRRVCVAARSVGRRARGRQPLGAGRLRHEGRHRAAASSPCEPCRRSACASRATSCSSRSSTRRRAVPERARRSRAGTSPTPRSCSSRRRATIVTVEGGLEWVRVVVRGRTGHSAVRYRSVHAGGRGEAVSAIEKA